MLGRSLWDRVRSLGRSNEELASADRVERAARVGADQIGAADDRAKVVFVGTIASLTIRPQTTTPWLEAELTDGTGTVAVIWMGRHEIPGIEAGRELRVEGRVSVVDGERRLFNPRYELL